ncbi:MAG TPA: flagellar hook-associated protein FlgK [Candidatus Sulfotelmatobacter sp.]|nr:flagellar hook-associated protein FlgK [Candidatus Sulfotelmatobacter sp.]
MGNLNSSLAIALSGLAAEEGALEATTNNVANVNTPGYSREVPVLATADPVVVDPLTLGSGVKLQTIESVRDPILESQIGQETQTQGQLSALVAALSQAQTNFTSTTGDIGTAISNFFESVNQLSTSPSDLSLRQNVLMAAGDLASAFNTAANNLTTQRTDLDQSVQQSVEQINQLTAQIAHLNTQISNVENAGESAGTFIDQRTHLIDQLSSLIDVSAIPTDNTLTLTTASGTPLVVGQTSFQLTTHLSSSGNQHIFSQGSDVTAAILSGKLGGILQARDLQIPAFQKQLDTLASGFADAVNQVQTAGYDLYGNPSAGNNLFNPPPSGSGAAASLSVAITSPALIAASSDGNSGSNGNAEAMFALRSQGIISGQNATDYYSGIVFNVGSAVSNANASQSASNLVLQQLNDQRSSISGVSLDEEAANMMRYQQAYAASAQVISTLNTMMEDIINMKNS